MLTTVLKITYQKQNNLSQVQYIITVRLTLEILDFLQQKKCIYTSKNQFILGDVLSLFINSIM